MNDYDILAVNFGKHKAEAIKSWVNHPDNLKEFERIGMDLNNPDDFAAIILEYFDRYDKDNYDKICQIIEGTEGKQSE